MGINKSIPVLGAGAWGTALAILLANNDLSVRLWDKNPELMEGMIKTGSNARYFPDIRLPKNLHFCLTLNEALEVGEDILIVVPSSGFKELLQNIKPLLTPKHRIVWATKGLEPNTGELLQDLIVQVLGKETVMAVISGPSFAQEVAEGLPTAIMVASTDPSFLSDLKSYFNNEVFSLVTTNDLIGVQLGGIVKNIIAVAAGLSDGLGFGANMRAALITQGLSEMKRLAKALGGQEETIMGLAGCGDVILTCTDNQSRNRRFGLALAKGLTEAEAAQEIGQAVEARNTVVQIHRLAKEKHVTMPIAEQVYRIMKQGVSPKEALLSLFK